MNRAALLVFSLFFLLPAALNASEIVVSPGTMTPHEALARIRAARAVGDRSAWTVRVKGCNKLEKAIEFTPEDSGTPEAPVRWIGEKGAVISGGERLSNWRDAGNGVWVTDAPRAADGSVVWFEQLWVNGRRAAFSPWPKNRFTFFVSSKQEPVEGTDKFRETSVFSEDVPIAGLDADELAHVMLVVRVKWYCARRSIAGYDAAKREVTTYNGVKRQRWVAWSSHSKDLYAPVSIENVRAAFTEKGEWFYDFKAGKIYYRPLPGEELGKVEIVAPTACLPSLVKFTGSPAERRYVQWVAMDNIVFKAAAPTADASAKTCSHYEGGQAAVYAPGAIEMTGARNIVLENCTVRNTGGYAVKISDGCMSNAVRRCLFEELGAGGLMAGAEKVDISRFVKRKKEWKNDESRPWGEHCGEIFYDSPHAVAFIELSDTVIRKAGVFNPEGVGVLLTHCSDSKVLHCEIHDLYYTGISLGWDWGYNGSVAQRNEIAFNRIYDLGKGVMSDMGGVYTIGTSHGTTIHDNVIHGIDARLYGGWGLYNDEGSENIVLYNNLVYDTFDASYHQHYGRNNVVRNNIFAFSKTAQAAISRTEDHLSCLFERNIFYWGGESGVFHAKRYLGTRDMTARSIWVGNIYWKIDGPVQFHKGVQFDEWRYMGNDIEGIVADPGFADPSRRDFRLSPDSPAVKAGFKIFDFSKAGPRDSARVGAR